MTVGQVGSAAGRTDDPRAKAMAAATAAMAIKEAAAEIAKDPGAATSVGISLTLGQRKSQSEIREHGDTALGATVAAGGNLTITARGAGEQSNVTIQGASISAGNSATLTAEGQVNLLAAQKTGEQHGTNSSSSSSIGVTVGMGSQNGISFHGGASRGKGRSDGSDVTWTNTHVNAGNTVTIQSGGDTNLKGAVVAANTVKAQVGGDLNVESLQDTSKFDSKQSSAGFSVSVCVPPLCYGSSSASVSASKAKAEGDFASVTEQSGIKAGDGGFQVNVQGNTDLKGSVLASTGKAIAEGKNSLITGTLTQSDIQNRDNYDASGYSIGTTFSGALGDQSNAPTKEKQAAADAAAKPGLGGGGGIGLVSGDQGSVTLSAISKGTLIIGNEIKQQELTGQSGTQTIAATNRDVTSLTDTTGALAKGWDGNQLMTDVQAQLTVTQAALPAAARAWAEFSNTKEREAITQADKDCWKEGGLCRASGHAVIGGLAGGAAGAAGAASSQLLVPALGDALRNTDLPDLLKQVIVAGLGTAIGAAGGGTAGAATGGTATVNNYLTATDLRNREQRIDACRARKDGPCEVNVIREYENPAPTTREASITRAC